MNKEFFNNLNPIESETKHTPGPWLINDGFISSGSGETYLIIADPHCSKDIDIDEREANAKLIAAAPELLNVLQYAVNQLYDHYKRGGKSILPSSFEAVVFKAKEIIKKATE